MNNFLVNVSKLRLKRSVTAIFFLILSILTVNIIPLSVLFSIIAIITGLLYYNKNSTLSLIIVFSAFLMIIISSLIIPFINRDPNYDKNVLIGRWLYNTNGGFYKFNENKTYYQYISDDTTNDYCLGDYTYYYGYKDKNTMRTIKQDYDFIYYTIIFKPNYCIFGGVESNNKDFLEEMKFVFGYNKIDKSIGVLLDVETNEFNQIKKFN